MGGNPPITKYSIVDKIVLSSKIERIIIFTVFRDNWQPYMKKYTEVFQSHFSNLNTDYLLLDTEQIDFDSYLDADVIIIGGGNVAMDAARTCVRLGAESVTVAYRRSQEQMPALLSEYEEARAEGVQFQWFASPVAVEGKDKGKGFKYKVMALNDDGAGIHGTGNFQVIPVDKIIIAAGHKPNARLVGEGNNLRVDEKGYILTSEEPYGMTSREGVFAGGDVVHKPATVVLAMREAKKAVDAGASVWVHAYNGMRGLTHRELGMVGAMYELPHTYAELICDGHHVDPKACDILLKQKGTENIALITDCMTAGGLQDGDYMLGEFPVVVANGTARLKSTGNLAGSILKLKDGLKNVVEWGIANPHEAVMMASLNPAKSVHIDDVCGQIREGYDADFIVLDKDLELVATYLDGEKRYQA